MPNIRSFTLVTEAPLLTTFQDPSTSKLVLVTTGIDGVPTDVVVDLVSFELASTNDNVRRWVGDVGGTSWTINTVGGYPGMTANCAS